MGGLSYLSCCQGHVFSAHSKRKQNDTFIIWFASGISVRPKRHDSGLLQLWISKCSWAPREVCRSSILASVLFFSTLLCFLISDTTSYPGKFANRNAAVLFQLYVPFCSVPERIRVTGRGSWSRPNALMNFHPKGGATSPYHFYICSLL